jgi:hypothetical protein
MGTSEFPALSIPWRREGVIQVVIGYVRPAEERAILVSVAASGGCPWAPLKLYSNCC